MMHILQLVLFVRHGVQTVCLHDALPILSCPTITNLPLTSPTTSAILLLEEGFDGLGALVIGDVKGRFVPFIFQLVEYRFECLDDGLIFQIVDWFRKYVVGIVVIRDEEVLHAIEVADRQCACLVGIHSTGLFIGQRCETKNIVSIILFIWLTFFFGSSHCRHFSLACDFLSSGAEARAMSLHPSFWCCWRWREIFSDEFWFGEEGYALQLVVHCCINSLLNG